MSKFEKIKFDKKKRHRSGLIPALGVCILALGIGFSSAIERTQTLRVGELTTSAAIIAPVKRQQTDVTVTQGSKTTERKTTAEKTTINPVADFFVMPVGGKIIKQFSTKQLQYSQTFGDWRLHTALDIAAQGGTAVHAAGNGRVREVYEDKQLGCVMVIDHGNERIGYYCGLKSPSKKAGDVVLAGKQIGAIGSIPSESVEAMHLHFAVMIKGEWADPIKALGIGVQ